ncbi:MAG TPA: DUF4288 domain-containing protein [Thermoanaerobaculia bacterium]|jgi:hypothetical protein|nr:DUF4288 domain-containing protein [Thermoanaerobaculia bacterium]
MWYSASLLFRGSHHDRPSKEDLWLERIVLIEASDEDQARTIAQSLGKAGQHQYATSSSTVEWQFAQVERLCEIEGLPEHGAELFWRFLRQSEVESLLTPFD